MALEVKAFIEVINIGYNVYRVHNLPWFRSLSWYFLVCAIYFFHGEIVSDYLISMTKFEMFSFLMQYHRLLSFLMYMAGFVMFVVSLVKGYYIRQFSLFAWTHVTLCLLVIHASLAIQNMFEGQFWLLVPVAIVCLNDIMAYMFGLVFGRTPLIALSPKKTWEGFIGGGVSTLVLSVAVVYIMLPYKSLTCQIEYNEEMGTLLPSDCTPNPVFQPRDVTLPFVGVVAIAPVYLHVLFIALFGSIVGPFGGFFASGFKRAFKIKDFDDIIPGHGGIMDRFDCHVLMFGFVNVYLHSVVKLPTLSRVIAQAMRLDPSDQLTLYTKLQEMLVGRNLLMDVSNVVRST